MTDSQVSEHFTSDAQEAALVHYRAYSSLAVVGLLMALLSAVAFWHPVMWFVPAAAALVNVLALWRISRYGSELAGRRLALAGLGLSLVLGIAAPTRHLISGSVERSSAQNFAMQWFAYLADGEPQMAAQLQLEPQQRKLPGDDVWAYYRDQTDAKQTIKQFVAGRVVRNLLALGRDAQVRYYETEAHQITTYRATMVQLYAVTFERDGKPTTFFVRLIMQKHLRTPFSSGGWWIVRADLVGKPPESWPEGDA